jgi:hypothetical protein
MAARRKAVKRPQRFTGQTADTAKRPEPDAAEASAPPPEPAAPAELAAPQPSAPPRVGEAVLFRRVGVQADAPALVCDVYPDAVIDLVFFHAPTYDAAVPVCSRFAGRVPYGTGERTWRRLD